MLAALFFAFDGAGCVRVDYAHKRGSHSVAVTLPSQQLSFLMVDSMIAGSDWLRSCLLQDPSGLQYGFKAGT